MKAIFTVIYPPVRQDIRWHRIVKIVGWIFSVASLIYFPIVFVVYFGLLQRAVFYIVYGEKKEEWMLVKDGINPEEFLTSESKKAVKTTKKLLAGIAALFVFIIFGGANHFILGNSSETTISYNSSLDSQLISDTIAALYLLGMLLPYFLAQGTYSLISGSIVKKTSQNETIIKYSLFGILLLTYLWFLFG